MEVLLSRFVASKEPLLMWPAANTIIQCGSQLHCGFLLVILTKLRLKHLAVGRPLYIGDTDIIIINSKNIKYQGNYILL